MEKIRVYELAKELNTTSKRLMEKLAEINIIVKNHMSLLEEHELEALYDHIGIIRHDESKKADEEEKKQAPQPRVEPKREVKKDMKSAPRIIRTTEIIIDSRGESYEKGTGSRADLFKGGSRTDNITGKGPAPKRNVIRIADASSGLRAGFVRDNRTDYLKDIEALKKAQENRSAHKDVRDGARDSAGKEARPEIKPDVKVETKPDTKAEAKPEAKPEAKSEAKPEIKPEVKPEIRPDVKPEAKVEAKPEIKHEAGTGVKSVSPTESKTGGHKASESTRDGVTPPAAEKMEKRTHGTGDRPIRGPREASAFHDGTHRRNDNAGGTGQRDHRQVPGTGDVRDGGHTQLRDRKGYVDRQKEGGFTGRQGQRTGDRRTASGVRPSVVSRPAARLPEIPKPDTSVLQKDEYESQRNEARREFQSKNADKEAKREQKKENVKAQISSKNKKFKPQTVVLSEKKGVSEVLSEDFILEEFYSDDDILKMKKLAKPRKDVRREQVRKAPPPKAVLTSITISESITVKDLAEALKKTSTEVIKKLMGLGMMATLNQEVDYDTASIIADEFGVKTEKQIVVNEEDILFDDSDGDEKDLEPRPPVVVVMGHVDHGKTSLLDAIRKTNVIESETGGITQHIGAYTVRINNRNITFLDTPGHEAFTAMRARGAQVTDIAILVVAADDGIMPQTVEAINHAKAANVSIVVAVNKIDKPGANPDKVKQQLTEYNLVPEEWGGDVICVPVSAKLGENIDHLLEMVLLTADVLELKANPKKQAKGTVIEAKLDKNRGAIATLLVQRGTLNVGDSIVTGTTVGRIRAMTDDKGVSIKQAGPSTPVEILGLPEVPEAGEIFYAITDEKLARQLADKRKTKQREQQLKASPRVSLDDLFNQIKEGKVKDLNIIVKADVQGSVEAIKQSLEKLSNEEVRVRIIHGGVGAVTESDVTLAQVSNAIIIGFNVRPGTNVTEAAENANVDIRLYRIIYDAIEDIQAAMKGMLEPTFREVVLGHAEIRQIFKVSGIGTIGGCYVTDGNIVRNADIRIVRNGIVIHEGKLASLKRFKDDAKEVAQGYECGLSVERFNDIKEGDIIEAYEMEQVER